MVAQTRLVEGNLGYHTLHYFRLGCVRLVMVISYMITLFYMFP
jgi:hypothetical protein